MLIFHGHGRIDPPSQGVFWGLFWSFLEKGIGILNEAFLVLYGLVDL